MAKSRDTEETGRIRARGEPRAKAAFQRAVSALIRAAFDGTMKPQVAAGKIVDLAKEETEIVHLLTVVVDRPPFSELPSGLPAFLTTKALLSDEWIYHDEGTQPSDTLSAQEQVAMSAQIWEGAVKLAAKQAQKEGEILTPPLFHVLNDMLDPNVAMDTKPSVMEKARGRHTHEDAINCVLEQTPLGEVWKRLNEWVDTPATEAELKWLSLSTEASLLPLERFVIERTRSAATDEGVRALARTQAWSVVARNPHLGTKGLETLAGLFVDEISRRAGKDLPANRWSAETARFPAALRAAGGSFQGQMEGLRKVAKKAEKTGKSDPFGTFDTLLSLARIPEAARDEHIRKVIGTDGDPAIEIALLTSLEGARWEEAATQVAEILGDPEWDDDLDDTLASDLEAVEAWQIQGVSRNVLVPFVSHDNARVRDAARKIALLQTPTTRAAKPAETQGSRGRTR